MKGKRKARNHKQNSPLASEILLGRHGQGRRGLVELPALPVVSPSAMPSTKTRREQRTDNGEEENEHLGLLEDLQKETTPGIYRSYLPCRLLDTLPANYIDVHPTEQRYCKVAVYRFMHQVEKKRKTNASNRRLGVDGTTYVTWQFMPQQMVRDKRRLGDGFFDEVGFDDLPEHCERAVA